MKSFTLKILDSFGAHEFPDVVSFVGEDRSGSFGIRANHARMITSLVVGLARFQTAAGNWRYIALPGAILHFDRNVLSLATRHSLVGDDYERISAALREQLLAEEQKLTSMKESLHRMEEEVLKRLWELGRAEASPP